MRKYKRKWNRFVKKFKKTGFGNKAMNMTMFIVGWILIVFAAILYVKGFGLKTLISNDAMIPTFQQEDVLKINRFIYKVSSPNRFDTVAVHMGETKSNLYYVLRIVGLPGETIQIQNGKIYIEDKEINYPINEEDIKDAGIAKDVLLLEENEYFMLCDNYNNSHYDSRSSNIGVIKKKQIEGRVN